MLPVRAQVGMRHLDRDISIVLEVVREVHGGHTAGAEFSLDGVAIRESGCEAVGLLGHRAREKRLGRQEPQTYRLLQRRATVGQPDAQEVRPLGRRKGEQQPNLKNERAFALAAQCFQLS